MSTARILIAVIALTFLAATVYLLNSDPNRLTWPDIWVIAFMSICTLLALSIANHRHPTDDPTRQPDKTDNNTPDTL